MPVGGVKKKQELPVDMINPAYLLLGTVTNCGDSIHWVNAYICPRSVMLQRTSLGLQFEGYRAYRR
ncbi:hypothetical protein CS537_11130 [Yersinia mollaretii]|nr:hypothetical protein CS537_11130 [Yersinia mollaretii]